jgi:hypothetical protein
MHRSSCEFVPCHHGLIPKGCEIIPHSAGMGVSEIVFFVDRCTQKQRTRRTLYDQRTVLLVGKGA